jgi:fatty-acyl-CoA synthase
MILVSDLLSERARLTPDRVALVDQSSGKEYTCGELHARACRIAGALQTGYNVRAGDRVALLCANSVIYLDLLFGLTQIGAIFVPLNWRLTARELSVILADFQPAVFIVDQEYDAVATKICENVSIASRITIANGRGASDAYDKLVSGPSAPDLKPQSLTGEDPAVILYTSGTTGKPKGVLIPHRQVVWNAINTVISWELSAGDISPVFTPLFHAGGLFVFLVPLIYAGGKIILARGFDPVAALDTIEREHGTVILGVPTMFHLWLRDPAIGKTDFSSVRWFISGGAPCPPSLIARWHTETGTVLRQGYGLTEVGVNCFSMTNAEALEKAGSVGKPIIHTSMRLINAEGQDVVRGAIGELAITGPHVTTGYWRNAETTRASLRHGWFHTGDMARQDEDGYFSIVGRSKDMLISGGENIYAAEVEAVFREHPAVADAALVGQPDEQWGEVGVMFIIPGAGAAITEHDLMAYCDNRIARFKIPRRVIFVDTLPYSPYGKVMKSELRLRLA